jgi:hypothetical protein
MVHLEICAASNPIRPAARCIPEFSAQTKLPCGQCHANPAGGGKLKAFGEKYKANGFKVK